MNDEFARDEANYRYGPAQLRARSVQRFSAILFNQDEGNRTALKPSTGASPQRHGKLAL